MASLSLWFFPHKIKQDELHKQLCALNEIKLCKNAGQILNSFVLSVMIARAQEKFQGLDQQPVLALPRGPGNRIAGKATGRQQVRGGGCEGLAAGNLASPWTLSPSCLRLLCRLRTYLPLLRSFSCIYLQDSILTFCFHPQGLGFVFFGAQLKV